MDRLSTRAEKLAHWHGVVGEWRASGATQAGFCRERGVPAWQFRYWLKRISDAGDAGGGPVFATVSAPGSGLRLVLPGGVSLEVEPGFDEGTLRRVVRAVSGC